MLEWLKICFLSFSKFQNSYFEKWLQFAMVNVERNKIMKFELVLSIHQGITRYQQPPPPEE